MNLNNLTLEFLEQECGISMTKLGDTSLREKLQKLDTDISDIHPPSGQALRFWQMADLNPAWLSLSGEYTEIQLKESIILPLLNLAKMGTSPFLMGRCSEFGGFSLEPDLAFILRALRHYFFQAQEILENQK